MERCRRILGERIEHLSDEEVAALCQKYELLAEITIEATIKGLQINTPDSND